MLSWFKPQRLFKASNVFKSMQAAQLKFSPVVQCLPYKSNMRFMCTTTTDYFKRVLKDHNPNSDKDFNMEKHVQDFEEFEEFHDKRREAIRQKDKHQIKFGLKDYELEDYKVEGATGENLDYKSIIQGKVPEDLIESDRFSLQIVDKLIPNMEIAVFNLTYDITEEEIRHVFVKYGAIDRVEICKNLLGDPSHAIISYKSHNAVESLQNDKNEIWIKSNLLKIKSRSDSSQEALENRTLVVGNLPQWFNKKEVMNMLSKFGSVIKIDMPMTDNRVEDIVKNLPNLSNENKLQHSYEERVKAAEKYFGMIDEHYKFQNSGDQAYPVFENTLESSTSTLAERIVNYEKEIQKRVASKSSVHIEKNMSNLKRGSENLKLVDNGKRMKVMTLCTMLYRESKMVNSSIQDIKAEHQNLINRMNNSLEYSEFPSGTKTESYITPLQIENLRNYLTYISKNHESLSPEILSELNSNLVLKVVLENKAELKGDLIKSKDITEKSFVDGIANQIAYSNINVQEELAKAYQWLLDALERREKILNYRINRTLRDYGNKDRVLFDHKDFKNELENIDYEYGIAGEDVLAIEDIISISEQMDNIIKFKGTDSDQSHLNMKYNPIDFKNPNFNRPAIESSKVNDRTVNLIALRGVKKGENIDQTYYRNSGSILKNYRFDVITEIYNKVYQHQFEMDTPFDEMYHKEKALIDNVTKAEKELQDAMKKNEKDLESLTNSIEDVYDNNIVEIFEWDDTRRLIKNLKFKNESGAEDSAESLFTIDSGSSKNYRESIEKWFKVLNNNYQSKVKKYALNIANMKNRGYWFVTFSHTDEAKKILLHSTNVYLDTNRIDFFLKNELDHHDFMIGTNPSYFKARTLADASLIGKREQLLDAKKKLAEYEDNFEEKMPKTFKLNKMKEAAKDAIDENFYLNRDFFPRSKQEDELLMRKAKKLEQQTGTDFSPLYQSSKMESENVKRHKKAFDTYKSYSFLKAGLKKTPLEEKLTGKEIQSPSEYNFPTPDEVTNAFVNKTYKTTLMDHGEENNNYGRKFKFSKKNFIESYFGKDFERGRYVNFSDRDIYSFNDDLKRQYSLDKLSTIPHLNNLQNEIAENSQEKNQEILENPELVDQQKIIMKQVSAEEGNTTHTSPIGQHPLLKGEFSDRMKKYYKDLHTYDENMKPKMNASQFRTTMKVEAMLYPKDKIQKVIDGLNNPRKPKPVQTEQKDATKSKKSKSKSKGMDGDADEKWKPLEEDEAEEDVQRHKEAIYSEYLDSQSADALKEGKELEYSAVRKKFAEKLIDKLKEEPQDLPKSESEFFKMNNDQLNYLSELQKKRSYMKNRKDRQEYNERNSMKNAEINPDKDVAQFELSSKINQALKNKLSKYKSEVRKKNEEFLYKRDYLKEHPESEISLRADETYEFIKMRATSKTDKAFKYNVDQTIDRQLFTDTPMKEKFLEKLGQASISEGLDARDEKLSSNKTEKNISQIAYGANKDTESIYKNYAKEQSPVEEDEQEVIRIREQKFLEEVERRHKEDSLKESRTFQEYENYKLHKQKQGEISSEFENKDSDSASRISKRDWLAKLWTGKVTAEEFEKYMMYTRYGQDKRGRQQISYEMKKYPGKQGERFITKDDEERLSNEMYEKVRRDAVMNGIVSEVDSHEYLEKYKSKAAEISRTLTTESFAILQDRAYITYKALVHGEQVREYYFDPKQGVSLEDHIKAIKTHPGISVETFVDKDGFTVIKKIIKKEYKHNIDKVFEAAPDEVINNIESKVYGLVKSKLPDHDFGNLI